jgi:hypothetical protein
MGFHTFLPTFCLRHLAHLIDPRRPGLEGDSVTAVGLQIVSRLLERGTTSHFHLARGQNVDSRLGMRTVEGKHLQRDFEHSKVVDFGDMFQASQAHLGDLEAKGDNMVVEKLGVTPEENPPSGIATEWQESHEWEVGCVEGMAAAAAEEHGDGDKEFLE